MTNDTLPLTSEELTKLEQDMDDAGIFGLAGPLAERKMFATIKDLRKKLDTILALVISESKRVEPTRGGDMLDCLVCDIKEIIAK